MMENSPPVFLTDWDLERLRHGAHFRSYESLGAHFAVCQDQPGVRFAVWAPNAESVSVIGTFNGWDCDRHPLWNRGPSGVWEGFVGGVGAGCAYKYSIVSSLSGQRLDKADPYAFWAELPPATASRVCDLESYVWGDGEWMRGRQAKIGRSAPIAIYEVHLGSWMRVPEEGCRWLTYVEAAERLADYAVSNGFTHIELMPVTEHPFGGSWGYQTTGYFAATSRHGSPLGFMEFVDTMHRRGVGVILDWAPAHFPDDPHGLALFDGTHLYDHMDARIGRHPHWGSCVFNLGRYEVANFLLSSALFWFDKFHVDGIRVDAVSSMLYRDYGREEGQWVPNEYGGKENLEAVEFLRRLNDQIHTQFPDVITIAEESTAWPRVSRPASVGGLGFDFKWNMGWMHDMLEYMSQDPVHRKYHHDKLTFSLLYAFSENYVLPLSHDEVVHAKGSLIEKMPGDDWQKFANLRLLYGYMYCHPGKKLLFMGSEIAQRAEWNHESSVDWHVLTSDRHLGVQRLVADLNRLYRSKGPLHTSDSELRGFAWVDCADRDASVVSFLRTGGAPEQSLLVVCHFTPVVRSGYRLGVPAVGGWRELVNTDSTYYGGSNVGNGGRLEAEEVPFHGHPYSIQLTLPPLATIVLEPAEASEDTVASQRRSSAGPVGRTVTGVDATPRFQ